MASSCSSSRLSSGDATPTHPAQAPPASPSLDPPALRVAQVALRLRGHRASREQRDARGRVQCARFAQQKPRGHRRGHPGDQQRHPLRAVSPLGVWGGVWRFVWGFGAGEGWRPGARRGYNPRRALRWSRGAVTEHERVSRLRVWGGRARNHTERAALPNRLPSDHCLRGGAVRVLLHVLSELLLLPVAHGLLRARRQRAAERAGADRDGARGRGADGDAVFQAVGGGFFCLQDTHTSTHTSRGFFLLPGCAPSR